MKTALKDYKEMIWKPSWKWLKKHWKGYTVLLAICMIGPEIWWYWDDIKTYIKKKFKRNKEES